MSSRYYPLFVKGNPHLRVFLPNFWMKLVKPKNPAPPNQVHFMVSMEMTKHDVKNYLEKIYNVEIDSVRTHVQMGRFKKSEEKSGYIIKDDDVKMAYVTLPKDQTFVFPTIVSEEKIAKSLQQSEETDHVKNAYLEKQSKNWDRPGVPLWFGK